MSTDRTDHYPEVSVDESGLVPPQGSTRQEWPKKIRTLTAAELDRLTIDSVGRFYWDGTLVNYAGQGRYAADGKPADNEALDVLDRAAAELSGRHTQNPGDGAPPVEPVRATDEFDPQRASTAPEVTAIAPAGAVSNAPMVEVRRDPPLAAAQPPVFVWPERVRVSLSFWQSLGLLLVILSLLAAAFGIAASGFVAAHDWGCRAGLVTRYCPAPPPGPKEPVRPDIPA
jgi:hypothetical protein